MQCSELVARLIPYLHCCVADASPARAVLEAWAEDPDGGELGALLQRCGAGPPSRALLTSLGSQAASAAQDLVVEVLAGAQAPVSSCIYNILWSFAHKMRVPTRYSGVYICSLVSLRLICTLSVRGYPATSGEIVNMSFR